jgi:hypothetical protein
MNHARRWGALLTLAGVAAVACTEEPTVPPAPDVGGPALSQGPSPSGPPETLHDVFARMNVEVPGFAGLHWDEDGHPVIRVVESRIASHGPAARSVTARTFSHAGFTPDRVRVVGAEYEWLELHSWGRALLTSLRRPGVVYLGPDELTNRILIGVTSEKVQAEVETLASQVGVPLEALSVELTEPLQTFQQTVLDYDRPVKGGLQIQINDSRGSFGGTMGFNVQYQGQQGFMTAAHLYEGVIGKGTGCGDFFQNADSDLGCPVSDCSIGGWFHDPPLAGQGDPNCPSPGNCRYSDAMVVEFDAGVERAFGRLARTTPVWGSFAISSAHPENFIQCCLNWEMVPPAGVTVYKVGRRSGWTYGTITATCLYLQGHGGVDLPCQSRVTGDVFSDSIAKPGDSGAPVYRYGLPNEEFNYYPDVGVALEGILIGGTAANVYWFSSIYGLGKDFGPFEFRYDGPPPGGGGGGGGDPGECEPDPGQFECA